MRISHFKKNYAFTAFEVLISLIAIIPIIGLGASFLLDKKNEIEFRNILNRDVNYLKKLFDASGRYFLVCKNMINKKSVLDVNFLKNRDWFYHSFENLLIKSIQYSPAKEVLITFTIKQQLSASERRAYQYALRLQNPLNHVYKIKKKISIYPIYDVYDHAKVGEKYHNHPHFNIVTNKC